MNLGLLRRARSAWEASPRSTVSADGGGAVYKEMLDFGGGLAKIAMKPRRVTTVNILTSNRM